MADFPLGICGLRRMSNTCYMNSFLQALSNSGLFRSYLFEHDDQIDKEKHPITFELVQLFKQMWTSRVILPFDFKKVVDAKNSFFGFDQQDCPDFANYILDTVHEEMKVNANVIIDANKLPENIKNYITFCKTCIHFASDEGKSEEERIKYLHDLEEYKKLHKNESIFTESMSYWKKFLEKNYSIITRTFMGLTAGYVQCVNCSHFSINMEPFYILQVCIPETEGNINIYDCIAHTFQIENMTEENAYDCSHCKSKQNAIMKRDIVIYPELLVVHVKQYHDSQKKLSKEFHVPIEDLVLKNHYNGEENRYKMYTGIKHFGKMFRGMSFGHYIAFSRSNLNHEWYALNDANITNITTNVQQIIDDEPYFLFFEKI